VFISLHLVSHVFRGGIVVVVVEEVGGVTHLQQAVFPAALHIPVAVYAPATFSSLPQ
jgi:hypothetical protein